MTVFLPTGSRLELGDECLGSAMYDDGIDETNEWMEAGTAGHSFLEDVANLGAEKALEKIEDPVVRAVCEEIDLTGLSLEPGAWAAEVTYAWNWRTDTARELGRGLKRNYSARTADEFVLTVDRVSLLGDDALIVGDYKFGFKRLRPARRHAQLRMGALAAARVYGRERVLVELIRPREGQRPYKDRAELDMFDLAEVASERRATAMAIRQHEADQTEPRLRIGDHCDKCRGRWSCRAQTAALLTIARDPAALLEKEITRQLTPELARVAYQRWRAYRAAAKPVEAALRAWAVDHPIQLDDGLVYGQHEVKKPIVDGRSAWDLLEAEHNREVAHAAVEVKTSKTAIRDALRPVAPKRGLTKLFNATMEKLSAAGAVEWKVEKRVEEFQPNEQGGEVAD